MDLNKLKIGFALTGSFCTIDKIIPVIETLKEKYAEVIPVFSNTVYETNNRFNDKDELIAKVEQITNQKIIHTITGSEPIGPKKLLDALVIAPCTGNTLGKLSSGITDTPVTMAAKSTLRNKRPVIIAVSTNDGLSGSAKNIGALLNYKNIYFVPFGQDDPFNKETSLVADFNKIPETLSMALKGIQIQPMIL